jgi:sterol desaturase/sphingolipid hydroxylase (fatty acid hydroxylase superfamily)
MLTKLVQHGLAIANQALHLGVWLALLTVIMLPLERLFAISPHRRRPREIAADLAFYFMNGVLPTTLLAIPLALLAAVVRQATPQTYVEWVAALPLGAKIAAGLVISEIGAYWGHRWSHEIPFLWRFHSIHHAPEHLDWLVNTRAHPVDMVFTRLCGLTPLYILGLAQPAGSGALVPVIVTVAGTFWAFFIHANLRWRLGPLEWLVSTPAFHHWHHTNDENRDHNYAALLPFVDRLFGTHHLPNRWPPSYGVDEPPPPGFVDQLLHPLASPPPRRAAADAGSPTSAS